MDADESWVLFGAIPAFSVGLALVAAPLYLSYLCSHNLPISWHHFLLIIPIAALITGIYSKFLDDWVNECEDNESYEPMGRFQSAVVQVINVVLAPTLLDQLVQTLFWTPVPCSCCCSWSAEEAWCFLCGLVLFTVTYHVWARFLHGARDVDVVLDIVSGSVMQVAVYAAARSNNYYYLMVVLLFCGGFILGLYSLGWHKMVDVDESNSDLDEPLVPQSVE